MSTTNVIAKKVNLNLDGLDANAWSVMSVFARQARKEKWSEEEIKSVLEDCMSSNYDHMLSVLAAHCETVED
jgi:hypothetical protein